MVDSLMTLDDAQPLAPVLPIKSFFIYLFQYRQAVECGDIETARTVSRQNRNLATISCLLGITFVAMVTTALLLQFLYYEKMADDMQIAWKQEFFAKTLNLTLEGNGNMH